MRQIFLKLAIALAFCSPHLHAAVRVINAGVPGQNTAEIEQRTERELERYKPQIVILFAGMNDAANDRKLQTPAESHENVENIVRICLQHHSRIVIVTLHQVDTVRLMQRHKREDYGDRPPSQRIDEMNAVLREVAREHHLPLAEFGKALASSGGPLPEYSGDGVHLTEKGYALLAASVRDVLPIRSRSETVLCLGDSLTYGIGVRAADGSGSEQGTYPAVLAHLLETSVR